MKGLRAAVLLGLAAAGCTSDPSLRFDGVTPGAGDAIRRNTLLQVVDLAPPGASDTRLKVPAVRVGSAKAADATASADPGASTSGGSD